MVAPKAKFAAGTATTAPTGVVWQVCNSVTIANIKDHTKCNGGSVLNGAAGATTST